MGNLYYHLDLFKEARYLVREQAQQGLRDVDGREAEAMNMKGESSVECAAVLVALRCLLVP